MLSCAALLAAVAASVVCIAARQQEFALCVQRFELEPFRLQSAPLIFPAAEGSLPPAAATAGRGGGEAQAEEPDIEGLAGFWQCAACTFANRDMAATECEVCGQPRRGGGGAGAR